MKHIAIYLFLLCSIAGFSQTSGTRESWNIQVDNNLSFPNLNPWRVAFLDSLGVLKTSITTPTELGYLIGSTSNIQNQINSKAPLHDFFNVQSGSSYTLALSDDGGTVLSTNSSNILVTIPSNASVAFPVGTRIKMVCAGAGLIIASPASGVTLNAPGAKNMTSVQFSKAEITKTAANTWVLSGDIRRPNVANLGTIVSQDYKSISNLSGYTIVNPHTSTFSMSSGRLKMIRTDANLGFTDYIRYDSYGPSILDRWIQKVWLTIDTTNANTFGFWLGTTNLNSFQRQEVQAFFECYTGATGRIAIESNQVSVANNLTGFSISNGDSLFASLERNYNVYTATFCNLRTGSVQQATYTVSMSSVSTTTNTRGKWAIGNVEGGYLVRAMTIASDAQKNVDFCFIGNSIVEGFSSGSIANSFVQQLMNRYPSYSFTKLASVSDYTAGIVSDTAEIRLINAKTYVIGPLAGNDVLYGISTTTWKSYYDTLVSFIKTIPGASVIHICDSPRNAYDMTGIRSFILSKSPNDIVVTQSFDELLDPSTAYKLSPIYDNGDGTHPNQVGQSYMARKIQLLKTP